MAFCFFLEISIKYVYNIPRTRKKCKVCVKFQKNMNIFKKIKRKSIPFGE